MGLFSRKRSKPTTEATASPTAFGGDYRLALLLLFEALPPLNQRTLQARIELLEPMKARLRVSDTTKVDHAAFARITYDEHSIRLVGLGSPAPVEAIHEAIECAHWNDEDKQPLRRHRSHVLCYYEGASDDPAEQLLACWKLAGGFLDDGLLGIVDRDAWNCTPAAPLRQLLTPAGIATLRKEPPLGIWTGFARMFKDEDEVWFCSKGFHRWKVVDFACLGRPSEAEEIFDLFNELFRYARDSQAAMAPGHTAQLGDKLLRFLPVSEYPEYLNGPLGTLVVEKIPAR